MDNIDIKFEEKWNSQDVQNIMNKVTNRYKRNVDHDDIDSIKMNTLWSCLKKYDEAKGTKFTSYLYQQLSYAMKNEVKKKRHEYNVDAVEKVDSNVMSKMEIVDIVTGLNEEDSEILQQRFFYNMTMKEIGKTNGYSRETARRRLKNAVKLCKNNCEI
jgi:RNA polymerase sigma factor (sigma-70 family)